MEIGVLAMLKNESDAIKAVRDNGFGTAQLQNWDMDLYTDKNVKRVRESCEKNNVRLAAFWGGYSGRTAWNAIQGPLTLGLVPPDMREKHVVDLKKGADFAAAIGAPALITHCGFIPETPSDPLYNPTINAIYEVASYCRTLGLEFWFETGQETPVTLLRAIEDLRLPNLGINLDTANLILYGRGNPVDALEVVGKYVKNLHIKDGLFPTTGNYLGAEVPVGSGKVDFDKVIAKLFELEFTGELIIEREIEAGEEQLADIMNAKAYLEKIIAKYAPGN